MPWAVACREFIPLSQVASGPVFGAQNRRVGEVKGYGALISTYWPGCDTQRWGRGSQWVTPWVRSHDRATRELFSDILGHEDTVGTGMRRGTLVPNFFPKMLAGNRSLETP